MRTTIKLLLLIIIFGCKNQPNNKISLSSEIKTENSEKQTAESIFKLIINRKETAENLRKEFSYDSIISLSEEEKSHFKKIGLNDGYYMTNIKFLKKTIDSIDFKIFYKVSFGDQLEKLVRIKQNDTIIDLILSQTGSDGQQSWYMNTEFLNDSIFIQTSVFKETAKEGNHSMAYEIDSTKITYSYNNWLLYRETKRDTFNIYKEYTTYRKNLKGKIFKTWSNIFEINNIRCHWEYEVEYTDETDENSKDLIVNLISQKLEKFTPREYILDLDLSKFAYIPPKSVADLEYNNYPDSSNDYIKDINSDGYDDIQFMTEHAGAGANIEYATYLFNPMNKKFEYSEIFSDYNIEYDSKKNRISSFMKSGVNNYYYRFKNLKDNKKDVEFIETIHHYGDTIFYKKMINEKVIAENRIVLGEYENWKKYLERK